jgi:methyl-accepting chemotaxis protein
MNVRGAAWQWLLALFTVAFIAVGLAWNKHHIDAEVARVGDRLLLLSNLRRQALESYFGTAEAELRFWSLSEDLLGWQREFSSDWLTYSRLVGDPQATLQELYIYGNPYPWGQLHELSDAFDGSRYSTLHAQLHPLAKLFVLERGYYDLLLVGAQGNVFYSVVKEKDYATNLLTGRWRDSGLAEVYRRAVAHAADDRVVISDMQSYAPSDGAPAIFMGKAMLDVRGQILGVLILQLPTEKISQIMHIGAGMGSSGETYLVGQDLLMRSNSRFSQESSILRTEVNTETVQRALAGQEGVDFSVDYRGVEVLSAYTSTTIDQFQWAVMAEIDSDEILQMAADQRPAIGGIMLLFYGLSLWSVWYGRGADVSDSSAQFADLDFDGGSAGPDLNG